MDAKMRNFAGTIIVPLGKEIPAPESGALAWIRERSRQMPLSKVQNRLTTLIFWLTPAIVIIALAGMQPFFPVDELLRDTYAVAVSNDHQMKPHYGALSMVGLFVWAASAAICFFAAAMFQAMGDRAQAKVFFFCGLFSSYLLADDAFLFHETVVPYFGGAEEIVLALIAIEAIVIAFIFRRFFRGFELTLLTAAVALLGFSAAYDTLFSDTSARQILIEDGAKFVGAFAWMGFVAASAHKALCAVNPPATP